MTDIKRRRKRSKLRVKAEEIDYKNVELLKRFLSKSLSSLSWL